MDVSTTFTYKSFPMLSCLEIFEQLSKGIFFGVLFYAVYSMDVLFFAFNKCSTNNYLPLFEQCDKTGSICYFV